MRRQIHKLFDKIQQLETHKTEHVPSKFVWELYNGITVNFLHQPMQSNKMTKRRGCGGQLVTSVPEEEEHEGSMGETHETKNATYEDTGLPTNKVAQTMKEIL